MYKREALQHLFTQVRDADGCNVLQYASKLASSGMRSQHDVSYSAIYTNHQQAMLEYTHIVLLSRVNRKRGFHMSVICLIKAQNLFPLF